MSEVKIIRKKQNAPEGFRKIKGVTYKIGDINIRNSGEVFYFASKDTWYILKNNKICWDLDDNRYKLKEECIDKICYITGLNEEKDSYEIGYSSQVFLNMDKEFYSGYYVWPNSLPDYLWLPSCNRYLITRDRNILSSAKSAYQNKPEYDYYDPRAYTINKDMYQEVSHRSKVYESIIDMQKAPEIFEELSKCFEDVTIGCEVETNFGSIPNQYLNLFGFCPVRDGSIDGWEYINYPYNSSANDLWKLYQFFDVCGKFTTANDQCSLHYHIGNVPNTKEFMVSIYTLVYSLQQELHQICLPYKKDARYLAKKRDMKDHCQALLPLFCTDKSTSLNQKMDNIASFFNEMQVVDYNPKNKPRYHLRDRNKWDTHSRYYILNMIPLLFKDGSGTVEFRLRHGTVNKYDAFYWLLICNALIRFADKKSEEILQLRYKYELADVFHEVYPPDIARKLSAIVAINKAQYETCKITGDMYNNAYRKMSNAPYSSLFYQFNNDNFNKAPKDLNFLPTLTDMRDFITLLELNYDYSLWPKSTKSNNPVVDTSLMDTVSTIFKGKDQGLDYVFSSPFSPNPNFIRNEGYLLTLNEFFDFLLGVSWFAN